LVLARELHVTPDEIRAMTNVDYLSLIAMLKLEAERARHERVHARNRPKRGR